MAIRLGDDGTLDTVIYCSECGEEYRFNYDPGPQWEDSREPTEAECEEDYDAWIDECLDEVESEHVCGVSDDGL